MPRRTDIDVARFLASRSRFGLAEGAFWAAAIATIWLAPDYHLILTETAIWALLALSIDLVLGYAGIITLGQAAFFGTGAYAAGLIAKYGLVTEPTAALMCAGLIAAALGFATSFLVLRGTDLTRLIVTLGVALVALEVANKFSDITGGANGLQDVEVAPILGLWRFDIFGYHAWVYTLSWAFVLFMLARRVVNASFGLSLKAIKGNPLRAGAVGIAVNGRLVAIYTLAAFYAGIAGGLLAQTQQFASLAMLSIDRSADALLILIIGGTGWLYGGVVGALVYRLLQNFLSDLTAQYWQFWIGLLLVAIVMVGRERIFGSVQAVGRLAATALRRAGRAAGIGPDAKTAATAARTAANTAAAGTANAAAGAPTGPAAGEGALP